MGLSMGYRIVRDMAAIRGLPIWLTKDKAMGSVMEHPITAVV